MSASGQDQSTHSRASTVTLGTAPQGTQGHRVALDPRARMIEAMLASVGEQGLRHDGRGGRDR